MWRAVKKVAKCAKSATVQDGEISKYNDILRGVSQGRTSSPTLFKGLIYGLVVAREAVKQGVNLGGDTVSVLMIAEKTIAIPGDRWS